MGTLRFLLALSVIIAHSTAIFGLQMVGGPTAVQTFYLISGFYMALILEKKYTGPGSYRLFLSNRFLRIFPIYWILLATVFCLSLLFWYIYHDPFILGAYFTYGSRLGLIPWIVFISTNLLLFGQDMILFLKLSPNFTSFVPTRNFWISDPRLYSFYLIPQAWTISVELTFYLIAPFLTKAKTRTLLFFIFCSLALRIFLYSKGLNFDPWTYRFFPTELLFFLVGILTLRHRKLLTDHRLLTGKSVILSLIVLVSTIFYQFLPNIFSSRQILYFAFVTLSLPFLFQFTNVHKFDRFLGELSYPIYIAHFLVLSSMGFFFLQSPHYMERYGLYCSIITSILAYLLVRFIANPIERFRQKRARRFTVSAVR